MSITKDDLCETIYHSLNQYLESWEYSITYPHYVIKTVVNELFFFMGEELKSLQPIEIRGLGTFSIVRTEPRRGRNFKTGESVIIPAKYKIKFIPSRMLTEPPAKVINCKNERDCPSRISTTLRKDGKPVRICRFYYRCPSRTQDLFQNIPEFKKEAKVLLVTTGKLIRGIYYSDPTNPELNIPVVIVYIERIPVEDVRLPKYYIFTYCKESGSPNLRLGPADVSFNHQTNRCYVRNDNLDFEFEIDEQLFKNDEVLKILLNAKVK